MNSIKNLFLIFFLSSIIFSCTTNKESQKCSNLKAENFQKIVNAKQTNLYFLKNGDIEMAVTNYGGRIVSLCTPGKDGTLADVVLGFKSIDAYLNANEVFHGALIGRVGNRIANGKFELGDETYTLPLNNGPKSFARRTKRIP